MNRIIFVVAAVVGLAAVAGSSRGKPGAIKTKMLPLSAVEVTDEASEALRRHNRGNEFPAL